MHVNRRASPDRSGSHEASSAWPSVTLFRLCSVRAVPSTPLPNWAVKDQGGASRRRWPGVSAAALPWRPARRTPGHTEVGADRSHQLVGKHGSVRPSFVHVGLVVNWSGDGPLSVRVHPSSLKHDCDRRATSSGNVLPELLRPLRSETKGRGSLPGPDVGHPLQGAGRRAAVSRGVRSCPSGDAGQGPPLSVVRLAGPATRSLTPSQPARYTASSPISAASNRTSWTLPRRVRSRPYITVLASIAPHAARCRLTAGR